jgi:RNA 2',3'-cyclic 3'-phosphodiesterase
MHRLFVAIRPPEEVRDQLIDLMDDGVAVRWQSDDQIHLTLRFIGEVERPTAEDIGIALKTIRLPRFRIALAGLGRFDHHRSGVLWAGVRPREELKALAAKVERACQSAGIEPERRAFHPHVTLARWNGGKPKLDALIERHGGLASDAWEVDRFTLYESSLGRAGAHYETIAEYRLGRDATGST